MTTTRRPPGDRKQTTRRPQKTCRTPPGHGQKCLPASGGSRITATISPSTGGIRGFGSVARVVAQTPFHQVLLRSKGFRGQWSMYCKLQSGAPSRQNPLCTATNSNCTTAGATFWGKRHPAKDSLYSMSEPHDAATLRGNLSQVNSKPQTLNNKP